MNDTRQPIAINSLYTVPLLTQFDIYLHEGEGALAALVDPRATGGLHITPRELVPEIMLLGQGSSLHLPLSYLLVLLPHSPQGLKNKGLLSFKITIKVSINIITKCLKYTCTSKKFIIISQEYVYISR